METSYIKPRHDRHLQQTFVVANTTRKRTKQKLNAPSIVAPACFALRIHHRTCNAAQPPSVAQEGVPLGLGPLNVTLAVTGAAHEAARGHRANIRRGDLSVAQAHRHRRRPRGTPSSCSTHSLPPACAPSSNSLTHTNSSCTTYSSLSRARPILLAPRCVLLDIDLRKVVYHNLPIRDRSLPKSVDLVCRILTVLRGLAVLRDNERRERICAVHCRGGIGRASVVIGCWLIKFGIAHDGAGTLLEEHTMASTCAMRIVAASPHSAVRTPRNVTPPAQGRRSLSKSSSRLRPLVSRLSYLPICTPLLSMPQPPTTSS
ncbi:uncharacterized protein PHACADRAFT_30499 [Phanerochaete carnosa HHB-10118-sp]|uniref:Swiss Army Knife protein DSP-PTPase phosphatase domain-containing protein n=1 Tax=Phanerochaete carnosa (strain HHB-10118-sp) TaxID=650164 RepID=K5VPW3_PHACS|nr:uncharacterized protein PHACADRAFT_30499 [Phanerochaete carnosa HHB-10118-sp]EKM53503.1 hypothetical protein PHACADRAFT_30499 [Phanerochaete carnosa HHB-10118-sp]